MAGEAALLDVLGSGGVLILSVRIAAYANFQSK